MPLDDAHLHEVRGEPVPPKRHPHQDLPWISLKWIFVEWIFSLAAFFDVDPGWKFGYSNGCETHILNVETWPNGGNSVGSMRPDEVWPRYLHHSNGGHTQSYQHPSHSAPGLIASWLLVDLR